MKLMYITNKVDIASHAVSCHAERIFIDLETLGKYERQGHLDTVISEHSLRDIQAIRSSLPKAELLVRINPLNPNTRDELEEAIVQGADIIMLPMFLSKSEIDVVGKMINNRVKFIPLIETKAAAENLDSYVNSPYVSEFYIGLNDLHRELGLKFMFELLSSGYVETLVNKIKGANKPFGFGGIATIGDGTLPARLILAEHVRLGSSSVILSRSFHQRSQSLGELKSKIDLELEIKKVYRELQLLNSRTAKEVQDDNVSLVKVVNEIVESLK